MGTPVWSLVAKPLSCEECALERHIIRLTYWCGVVCVVLALVARVLDPLGITPGLISQKLQSVGYNTFLDGAFISFTAEIATFIYASAKTRSN